MTFLVKVKILFGVLLVSRNKYYCGSFIKAKQQNVNFQVAGNTLHCVLPSWLTKGFIGTFYFSIAEVTCTLNNSISNIL